MSPKLLMEVHISVRCWVITAFDHSISIHFNAVVVGEISKTDLSLGPSPSGHSHCYRSDAWRDQSQWIHCEFSLVCILQPVPFLLRKDLKLPGTQKRQSMSRHGQCSLNEKQQKKVWPNPSAGEEHVCIIDMLTLAAC